MTPVAASLPCLQGLFEGDILAEAAPIPDGDHGLFDEERRSVRRALPVRRAEFAAGRRLARKLLTRLRVAMGPLVPDSNRAPVWPPSAVGSIAHASGLCVAAVARSESWKSLGIDVEPEAPLERELWETICTEREISRDPSGCDVRRLFVAKEAVFKCQYPLTGRMLDFPDVEISFEPDGEAFIARLSGDDRAWHGRVYTRAGWILAGAWA